MILPRKAAGSLCTCYFCVLISAMMYMDSFTGIPLTTWSVTVLIVVYLVTCMMTSTAYDGESDDGPTYFIPQPQNVSFHRGETAILQCSIENLGSKFVVWRKASEPNPISVGELIFAPDKRFNVSFSKERREFDLLIRDVQPHDSGVYECQVSSVNKIIRHVLLRVNDTGSVNPVIYDPRGGRPKPSKDLKKDIKLQGKGFVNSGETIRLICNITGVTDVPQDLDWFKDGMKLRSGKPHRLTIRKDSSISTKKLNSVLEIFGSRLEDAGTYVCRNSEFLIASQRVIVLDEEKNNPDKRGTAGEAHNCQICNRQWWTLFLTTLVISLIAKGSLYIT